jgi:predicted lipoprotein with Yx(FWY)xxD motif
MRKQAIVILPTAAVSLLLAACGSSNKSSSSSSSSSTSAAQSGGQTTGASSEAVKTGSTSLGTVLVNGQGMTLYHLSGEQNGKFICTSEACTGIWHPLTVSSGGTPSGAVGSLGTVKRPDGTTQVTYKGSPLYTFAQDQHPGEAKGQGVKDVGTWSAVTTGSASASSSASSTPATSSAPAAPSSSGEGKYGY